MEKSKDVLRRIFDIFIIALLFLDITYIVTRVDEPLISADLRKVLRHTCAKRNH